MLTSGDLENVHAKYRKFGRERGAKSFASSCYNCPANILAWKRLLQPLHPIDHLFVVLFEYFIEIQSRSILQQRSDFGNRLEIAILMYKKNAMINRNLRNATVDARTNRSSSSS